MKRASALFDQPRVVRGVVTLLSILDPRNRTLKFGEAVRGLAEEIDTERLKRLGELVAKHLERASRLGGDDHPLARGEEMADQVRDRVALAGSRGALDEHALVLANSLDDVVLFAVRREREVDLLVDLVSSSVGVLPRAFPGGRLIR